MSKRNFLETLDEKLEIVIKETKDTNLTKSELRAEAILSLIGGLDLKEFDEDGVFLKYEEYMNRIYEELKENHRMNGWDK